MNPCGLDPCQNGGSCISKGFNYTCYCSETAYGNNCQFSLIKNMNDSTILSSNTIENLKNLLNFSSNKPLKLLYQSSKDGFNASTFHSKCDEYAGTLIVMKSNNSNIFGAYTSSDWSGNDQFKYDSTAFLFSLVNSYNNVSIKMNILADTWAIYCHPNFNIMIGADLYCYHNQCFSNLGYSYQLPSFLSYGSNESMSFLAGNFTFQPVEMEVYWIDRT